MELGARTQVAGRSRGTMRDRLPRGSARAGRGRLRERERPHHTFLADGVQSRLLVLYMGAGCDMVGTTIKCSTIKCSINLRSISCALVNRQSLVAFSDSLAPHLLSPAPPRPLQRSPPTTLIRTERRGVRSNPGKIVAHSHTSKSSGFASEKGLSQSHGSNMTKGNSCAFSPK